LASNNVNFDFILPQKIIFGEGSITKIGDEAKGLGANRALIVTSRGMLKREFLTRVTNSLQEHLLSFEIFSDVNPEPPIENIYDCTAFAKENGCNLVIGLGGGSAMDVAKKVAAHLGLPKIMIPTTAGTGSEVTHESVFKVDGKKKAFVSQNLMPDVAIVDPDLTMTMPPRLTACSGIDALAHALECYESMGSNSVSKILALKAFKLLKENIREAVDGEKEARMNMSLGSLMAGMAFGNSGTALGHALSYPLSNRGVPRGEAVAMVLPYSLEFNGADAAFINEIRKLAELIKPKWGSEWNIHDMAGEVMADERHLSNNHRKVIYDDVLKIFEQTKTSLVVR